MVKGTGVKARHKRNILTRMDGIKEGPLMWLNACRLERKKIKVNIKNNSIVHKLILCHRLLLCVR